jgi:DNA (cytosine-5)-methyltransferase 1
MHNNTSRHQIVRPLILSAGFPCQDASRANAYGKGIEGERTGLFWEIDRLVGELRPEYVFLENVANFLIRGWEQVLAAFAKRRMPVWYRTVSAETIGYPFQGKRIYAVAFSPALGLGLEEVRIFDEYFEDHLSEKAQQNNELCREISLLLRPENYAGFYTEFDGLPDYLAPLGCHYTGNAIIPDMAEVIFKTIKEFHEKIIKP